MNDLRRICIDKRISQFDLSLKSRVHPSRISLIENNRTTPTGSEINRISDALGMLPEEVFGLDAVMRRLTPVERKRPNNPIDGGKLKNGCGCVAGLGE